jgi:hypothetical protein
LARSHLTQPALTATLTGRRFLNKIKLGDSLGG